MVARKHWDGRLDLAAVILVGPRYPENIGAAARVALNFGIPKLIVVSTEKYDEERMLKMATHKAAHLIREMEIYPTTGEAAAPFNFIVATTARQGRRRIIDQTPGEVIKEVAPLLMAGNKVALMFGPENTGLTNEDLDYCHFTSTIPTADFSSLNLAQAVAIHCHELYMAVTRAQTPPTPEADFANSYELEGMFGHIEQVLTFTTFLKDNNNVYWMRSIRQFLYRIRLKKKEAAMIRGICRKFLWHQEHGGERAPSDAPEEP